MSRKRRSGPEDEAARAAREEAAAVAKLKAAGEAPLRRGLGQRLESIKQAMEAEAQAKARAADKAKARAGTTGSAGSISASGHRDAAARVGSGIGSSAGGRAAGASGGGGGGGPWQPDRDKELLAVAMSGVVPLREKRDASGRPLPATPGAPRSPVRDAGQRHRRAQAEGDEGLQVQWDEQQQCRAARRGRTFALEALGRFAVPQDTLDLHRSDPSTARTRVEEFVRTRRARGMRVVCVVHGVGRHAPDGECVLRDVVVRALSEPPGSREVDAFQTADKAHGGHGAVLVALRGPEASGRR